MGNCFCKRKCIICRYNMNNTDQLVTMSSCCGQVLHQDCYINYNNRHRRCPNCKYTTFRGKIYTLRYYS